MAKKKSSKKPVVTPDLSTERGRLQNLGATAFPGKNEANTALSFYDIANELYAPGKLGRVSETTTPEIAASLASAKGQYDQGRSPEAQAALNTLQGLYGQAGTDPFTTEALTRMQTGLGGYTSPELQAQREQALQSINGALRTGLRATAGVNATGNVNAGGAQSAYNPLLTRSLQDRANLERSLLADNARLQDSRLQAFGGLASQEAANRFSRQYNAANAYQGALLNQQQQDDARKQYWYQQYNTGLYNNQEDLLRRQTFNLNQANSENLGRVTGYTSGGAVGEGRNTQAKVFDLQEKAIKAAAAAAVPSFDSAQTPSVNWLQSTGGPGSQGLGTQGPGGSGQFSPMQQQPINWMG